MQYRFSKCPSCGASIDFFKKTGWNDIDSVIGNPFGCCLSCLKTHKTGKHYWADMDSISRFGVYLRIAFGAVMGGIIVAVIIGAVFFSINSYARWIESNSEYSKTIFVLIIIGMALSLWSHLANLEKLKKLPGKPSNPNTSIPIKPAAEGPKELPVKEVGFYFVSGDNKTIAGMAWKRPKENGGWDYGSKLYAGSDPLDVFECAIANHWQRKIDSKEVSLKQCQDWLSFLEGETSNRYYSHQDIGTSNEEFALLIGLVNASIEFLIGNINHPDLPASFSKWFKTVPDKPLRSGRELRFDRALKMQDSFRGILNNQELFILLSGATGLSLEKKV